MQRMLAALFALMILLTASASAAEYPARQGAVTDLADVLSDNVKEDVKALSTRYFDVTGGHVYVMTRHFLGGTDAREYAQKLFSAWGLEKYDALLVMVIGEETYALEMGEKAADALPSETRSVLLGSHFRTPYMDRAYDLAVSGALTHLTTALARAEGKELSTDGLFGSAAARQPMPNAATPRPSGFDNVWNSLFSSGYTQDKGANAIEINIDNFSKEDKNTGFSLKRLIIFAIIVYFIFFRKKRRRFNFDRSRR